MAKHFPFMFGVWDDECFDGTGRAPGAMRYCKQAEESVPAIKTKSPRSITKTIDKNIAGISVRIMPHGYMEIPCRLTSNYHRPTRTSRPLANCHHPSQLYRMNQFLGLWYSTIECRRSRVPMASTTHPPAATSNRDNFPKLLPDPLYFRQPEYRHQNQKPA